jgi:hypothetical protein
VGGLGGRRALAKPEEASTLKRRTDRVPRIYIIDEPPVTLEVDGRRYECVNVIQAQGGLLCVQYDGSVALIPQPAQQQAHQQAPQAQLV